MPKTSDPNITITHKNNRLVPYGVKVLQCGKKASLEIKLVNIMLCKCSWYILNVLSDLAYGVNEGLSRAGRMFQV